MSIVPVRCLMPLWCALLLTALASGQVSPEKLTYEEEKELKTLLAEASKAKPGISPINLSDDAIKRQFDLVGKIGQYGLLRINKSMMDKKYQHESDFVAFYMSRYPKLFDEKLKNAWLLAYAAENKTEKSFFDKMLDKTGLKGAKRDTVITSYYHLLYPAERVYYMEIVSIVYKNNEADFSLLPKRAKDFVAERNAMFP